MGSGSQKVNCAASKGKGFGYKTAKASGIIENGVIRLEETYLNGKSVDLALKGTLDIPQRQVDLTALVTPLVTVDSIIEKIPLIGHLAGDNFMAVPVKVRGDFSNPKITPISPSSVGKGLLRVMERTMKLPIKVVQPFMDDKEKGKKADSSFVQ